MPLLLWTFWPTNCVIRIIHGIQILDRIQRTQHKLGDKDIHEKRNQVNIFKSRVHRDYSWNVHKRTRLKMFVCFLQNQNQFCKAMRTEIKISIPNWPHAPMVVVNNCFSSFVDIFLNNLLNFRFFYEFFFMFFAPFFFCSFAQA